MMQLERFGRMLGLPLVISLAGFMGGCGSGGQAPSPDPAREAKLKKDMREGHLKNETLKKPAATAQKGRSRGGS
jgi:hypothetical protein